MISSRFAPILCALVGIALVPTFIHSYAGFTVGDDRATSAIPAALAGYTSAPTARNATWGQRRFDSFDWMERNYSSGAESVRLTVVRSYDLKALYHHPELAVAYGTSFAPERVTRAAGHPDVPVHVLTSTREEGPAALYVLHYDGRFIDDPITFQLRTAGELLVSGRKPMTLFFVTDMTGHSASGAADSPAGLVLFDAIDKFVHGNAPQ